jgi:flagellum-specific peptidoglycan hydrolase FlgJ
MLCLGTSFVSFTSADEIHRPPQVEKYIQKFGFLAKELNQQTGIPAPIILAMAGLESQWGKSDLALRGNNHFGLKAKEWAGPVYCKETREVIQGQDQQLSQCFRKYPLVRHSYQDFGRHLATNLRYRQLFYYAAWDYRSWAHGLEYYNYATDPEYAEKLVGIIERYGLDSALE